MLEPHRDRDQRGGTLIDGGGEIACPYCGEPTWIAVDPGGSSHQQLINDCEVCCRPIHVVAAAGADGTWTIQASTDG